MGHKYLGKKFDIHGGGIDLKFPHHDCEIAQSKSVYGENPANYWIHTNMLTLNGKKMSKSSGNSVFANEIFEGSNKIFSKSFSSMTLKFFMYQAHYRNILDLSNDALSSAEKGYNKLLKGFNLINNLEANTKKSDFDIDKWISNCYEKMNDDFNTPMLISELFECIKFINNVNIGSKNLNIKDKVKIKKTFEIFMFDILGLINETDSNTKKSSDLIQLLIKIRHLARINKNFELSDQIRDDLLNLGIQLNDKKNESSYKLI